MGFYMSGDAGDAGTRRGAIDAAVRLLEKPFTAHALLSAVSGILGGVRTASGADAQ
jgi:hypothetical protein